MENNMEDDMGPALIQGFMGMIYRITVLDSSYDCGIGSANRTPKAGKTIVIPARLSQQEVCFTFVCY